jgi:hypothetical protein
MKARLARRVGRADSAGGGFGWFSCTMQPHLLSA